MTQIFKQEVYTDIDLIQLYKDSKPKYLLICSYTLDLSFLEHRIIFFLRKYYDTRTVIVTSRLGYVQSFSEGSSLSGVGRDYAIYQINDYPYVFHPKIFLFIDQNDKINLYVSGANFTYPGLWNNLDCIDFLSTDDFNQMSINNLSKFLKFLDLEINTTHFSNFIFKFTSLFVKNSPVVNNKTFLTNSENSLIDSFISLIEWPIKTLKIISPFYDHDFSALKVLISKFNNPKTDILCNAKDSAINLKLLPKSVRLFISSYKSRTLHTKLFLFFSENNITLITGSANCTKPALLSKVGAGNCEAIVVSNKIALNHADFLWDYYKPKQLKKTDYWLYSKPSQKNEDVHRLIFTVTLDYDSLKIIPKTGFPNSSFSLHYTIENQYKMVIEGEKAIKVNTGEFLIELTPSDLEKLDNKSAKLELRINDVFFGSSWIIQSHLLRRSNKLKLLENTIESLRRDHIEGWNQILELIDFISENLALVSSSRTFKTSIEHPRSVGPSNSSHIITINGIYDIDQEISHFNLNPKVGEFLDLGRMFQNLIENGLAIDNSEDDVAEEEDYDDYYNISKKNKINKADSSSLKNETDSIPLKLEIINNIPHFNSIFDDSIVIPIDKFIEKNINNPSEIINLYNALVATTLFCLKLVRFIRLELVLSIKKTDKYVTYKTFINESSYLLKWFWQTTLKLIKVNIFNKEDVKNVLESSDFLYENLILMIEFWTLNYEFSFGDKLYFEVFDLLCSSFGIDKLKNSTNQYLRNSKRFNSGRQNNFIINGYENILDDIIFYNNRLKDPGVKIRKFIKYHYWKEANVYHNNALPILAEKKSSNQILLDQHKVRAALSEKFLIFLKANAREELQIYFDDRLFDPFKLIGISEIENNFEKFTCPKCHVTLGNDTFLVLKQIKYISCHGCNSLFLPVNKYSKYIFRESDDSEWNVLL